MLHTLYKSKGLEIPEEKLETSWDSNPVPSAFLADVNVHVRMCVHVRMYVLCAELQCTSERATHSSPAPGLVQFPPQAVHLVSQKLPLCTLQLQAGPLRRELVQRQSTSCSSSVQRSGNTVGMDERGENTSLLLLHIFLSPPPPFVPRMSSSWCGWCCRGYWSCGPGSCRLSSCPQGASGAL